MVQAFAPLLIEAKGIVSNQGSTDAVLNMVWACALGGRLIRRPGIFSSSEAAEARLSEILRRAGVAGRAHSDDYSKGGSADMPTLGKPGGVGIAS